MNDAQNRISVGEMVMCHCGCMDWGKPEMWDTYLGKAQELLGSTITHLDKNDPIRRRIHKGAEHECSSYIASFEGQQSRWVFGKTSNPGIEFSIRHYENPIVVGYPNTIQWYFTGKFLTSSEQVERVVQLFDVGNQLLQPFYSYADSSAFVSAKNRESGAVDIQTELPGIFWLTYFNSTYISHIGPSSFGRLKSIHLVLQSDATLRLGPTPTAVEENLRSSIESGVAPNLFVNVDDNRFKKRGEYALTFETLRSAGRSMNTT